MTRRLTLPALLTAVALTLAGCSGTDAAKEKSLGAFAAASCSGIAATYAADDALPAAWEQIDTYATPAEQHAFVVGTVQGHIDYLAEKQAEVEKAAPAVAGGAAAVKALTRYYSERIDWAENQLADFAATVPDWGPDKDGVKIAATDILYSVLETGMPEAPDFPYASINDQEVIKALKNEPACNDVVTVF